MKRRNGSTFSLVVLLALFLAACSSPSTPTTAPATSQGASGTTSENVAPTAASATPVKIHMARFFGDCDDSTANVTDVSKAKTECEVIQILTNKFNAENKLGITVERLGGAEWGTYYDALNATFAGGERPDIAVMHGSNIPDYASRGLLLPIGDLLAKNGVDSNDWTAPARGAVTYNNEIYAVPFDLHANLFHVNVDIFKEAGLVDANGTPILPTSRAEFMAQAQKIKDLGYTYLSTDASQFPIGVRIFFTLVWQQGSDLIASDGKSANVNSPEAKEALDFMLEMFKKGYADPNANYDASQAAFLNGNAAILHNGTWAVDQYNREAKFKYMVMDFPTLYSKPATWANSHMWTIPKQEGENHYDAAIAFLTFLNDHVADWAIGTGHLAPRTSVLESSTYKAAPQRANYAKTATIAKLVPAIVNWQSTEDILKEELESTWLTGKDPAQALSSANERINSELSK